MSLMPPYTPTTWKILLCVGGLIVLALIFYAYCGGKKDETPLITNIGIDAGKNAVITNLLVNKEKEVNVAVNQAEKANANLANAILRDSNTFSGNGDDAEDAFCSRFKCDSSCSAWRSRHEVVCR